VSHVPTRTCLGCRERRAKPALVRLVRRADGVVVADPGAALPGRGAYVCPEAGCVERALKPGKLAHAFRAACRPGEGVEFTVLAAARAVAVAGHDTGL
jgi:predicted RNA-binding protein YlxR (DUF448 family)